MTNIVKGMNCVMRKINIPYGMPEVGGTTEIPKQIPGPPGFGVMPDFNEPEPEGIPHAQRKPQIKVTDGELAAFGKEAKIAGTITKEKADELELTCDKDTIDGILIDGASKYCINNAKINLSGNCINDFDGNGAGIQALGSAVVEVANTEIVVEGVLRSCLNANEYATMYVHDSTLICKGGEVPEGWPGHDLIGGPGMVSAPPSMGVSGHSRLSLTEGNAHSYFKNCKVISDGWAGLSTDGSWGDCYLQIENCDIEVKNPGYGTFSDEGCLVVVDNCNIKTASHTIMLDRKGRARMSDIQAESGKYFAYFFSVLGNTSQISELIVNNSTIHTGEESILVSGCNAYVDMRNTKISSDKGIVIASEISSDPMNSPMEPGEKVYGIKIVLSDMEVCGDIVHVDANRTMAVSIRHTSIHGGIQNAHIQMDAVSSWYATKDSEVTMIGDFKAEQLDAPEGVTITAVCEKNMTSCTLPSGGKLVVK